MKRIYSSKLKPRSDFYLEDFPISTTITVHEETYDPVDTGLLDPDGNPIYATMAKDPIGFVHWEE